MVIQWSDDYPMVILLSHPCSSHWSQWGYMALRRQTTKFTESQDFQWNFLDVESPSRVINHFISISCQPESAKFFSIHTRKKPCSIRWTAAYCCHVAGATTGWRTHPTGFVGNPGGQESWCTWADSTQKWPRTNVGNQDSTSKCNNLDMDTSPKVYLCNNWPLS